MLFCETDGSFRDGFLGKSDFNSPVRDKNRLRINWLYSWCRDRLTLFDYLLIQYSIKIRLRVQLIDWVESQNFIRFATLSDVQRNIIMASIMVYHNNLSSRKLLYYSNFSIAENFCWINCRVTRWSNSQMPQV